MPPKNGRKIIDLVWKMKIAIISIAANDAAPNLLMVPFLQNLSEILANERMATIDMRY